MNPNIINPSGFNWSENTELPQRSTNCKVVVPIVNNTGTAVPELLVGIAC